MAAIELQNVVAGYGAGPDILTGLSLKMEAERSYCIIGPNGAGKSTMLKVICGLLQPRSGRVVFNGNDMAGLRPDQVLQRGICFVPQERALFPRMTVRENLRMGGYILDDRAELERRIDDVLDRFPILRERAGQLASTMSGGQQQMLTMARTMIVRPQIVMLDEPSLGLAPKIVDQVYDIIKLLRDEGITILLIEQNALMGLKNADWGVVLDLGKTLFEGPADEILADERIQELYLGRKAKAA